MSDQFGERTEEATPRKRQEARDEGRTPRSPELSTAALLLGVALVLSTMVPALARQLLAMMGEGLATAGNQAFAGAGAVHVLQTLGWRTLAMVSTVAAAMGGIALAVNAVQARGIFSAAPLRPKLSRLSPLGNARRIFGIQAVVELLKAVLKLVIVAAAIRTVLGGATIERILATAQQSPIALLDVVRHYAVRLVLTAGLAYLVLAAADYLWQYWRFTRDLRMSREEVKQEIKNIEGDPLLKQRIRSMARNRARQKMLRDVPRASVVIVNPTHRAVAIQYDPATAPAPVVLAMGERKVAERIKEIALAHDIPVVENRPLAVALLKHARVGMVIPVDLYLAVAEVLAFVIRQRTERGPAWAYRPVSHLIGDSV